MKYDPQSENGGFIKQQMKCKWDVFLIYPQEDRL